ncbi:MAG: TonB-dependent copper receptor [Thalassolituus sp.]
MSETAFKKTHLVSAIALFHAAGVCSIAHAEHSLDDVVITAPATDSVLTVTTDPKAPRQPIPAHDGADLLKNIPGFSVIRKGGTDGDPVLRGMAGSRLGILLDGETILGGCGNRMDPPTAYVFPQAYDQVTVLKGPQSVMHGSGNSAGTVLFEKAKPDFSENSLQGDVSALMGSADRNDQMAHLLGGNDSGYLDLNATRSDANNYEDGDGNEVHSAYTRWSTNAALGWTPDRQITIEVSGALSDGEARYADRAMDGVKFDRSNAALRAEKEFTEGSLSSIEGRVYRNYVDHVMDNFSLRTNTGVKGISNPDRETIGATLASTWQAGSYTEIRTGLDHQRNNHRVRSANNMMNPALNPSIEGVTRVDDMRFNTNGVYIEADILGEDTSGIYTGLRVNRDKAEDLRLNKTTTGETDVNTLTTAFLRYELQIDKGHRTYIGVGHAERAADYWERTKNPAAMNMMMTGAASTFLLDTEKTTQLDTGLLFNHHRISGSVSAFYAQHRDYILIEQLPEVSTYAATARNIRATTYGGEAEARYDVSTHWQTNAAVSWVHGQNDTDNTALSQIAPPELRLGANYIANNWSAGALWRLVDDQTRADPGTGNIVGQDLGETAGFNVVSLNASWTPTEKLKVSTGIDNLFDVTYAEHISRSGANITGYEVTDRVNEPGRTFWLQAQAAF